MDGLNRTAGNQLFRTIPNVPVQPEGIVVLPVFRRVSSLPVIAGDLEKCFCYFPGSDQNLATIDKPAL